MKNKPWLLFFAVTIFLLSASATSAHHSMFGYDRDHDTSMRATVTEFSWSNPHAQLFFEVKKPNGAVEKWMAEMPSPNRLDNSGWTKETLKPGDQITVVGNCSKDGAPSMRLRKVVLSNGQELAAYTF